jgi:hypothetical protein
MADLKVINVVFCGARTEYLCATQCSVRYTVVICLRRLIAGLSPCRPNLNPTPFVRILVDEVAPGKVFIRVLHLWPVSVSPPVLRTLLHLHAALTRRANKRSLRNFQKQVFLRENGEHWTIKLCFLIFKIKHILSCVLRKANEY